VTDPELARAVEVALPSLVVSLASWGVRSGHWLPDRDGAPVVWLTTRTEQQRTALESAYWLPNQVGVLLMRAQIPHEEMRKLRILVDSEESQQRLLEESV
jgi:hypothetical protein